MLTTFIIRLLLLLAFTPDNTVVQKSSLSWSKQNSLSYTAIYSYKGSERQDTTLYHAQVMLLRSKTDTITGGYIKIIPSGIDKLTTILTFQEGSVGLYDLQNFYMSFPQHKRIVSYNPHTTSKPIHFSVMADAMIWKSFLKPEMLATMYGEMECEYVRDTVINSNQCYAIKLFRKKENRVTWVVKICFIKTDYTPILKEEWSYNGLNVQYERLLITNYSYNEIRDISVFSKNTMPHGYKTVNYAEQ